MPDLPFEASEPDSLMGAIMALEGIEDAVVLLNGPTGCKTFYGWISGLQYPRADQLDPARHQQEFYFGQARVPTTYLDEQDYIFGGSEKLARIFAAIAAEDHGLIGIVNSPGAALIGDDLQRFLAEAQPRVPTIAIETPGFSASMTAAHQQALRAAIAAIDPPVRRPDPHCVNLLGTSIYQRHWQGDLAGLRELLAAMGIRVGAALGAGCSVAEIRSLRAARHNVVLQREYADTLGPWVEECYGVPTIFPAAGAPIGFEATEQWLREVAAALGCDPAPALRLVEQARRIAFRHLYRFHHQTGLPKGATFAVRAEASTVAPLVRWLHGYLGMVPVAIQISGGAGGPHAADVRSYLRTIGCEEAWEAAWDAEPCDLVLANGPIVASLVADGLAAAGIELSMPATEHIDVLPKALLGSNGALFLLERILNQLRDRVW